jgi:hypothetical protein
MKNQLEAEKIKIIHTAMWRVWEVIGGEFFQENNESFLSREEVIEVVLDANYLESFGNCKSDILKEFINLSYEDQEEIAKQKFIHERYD